MSRSVWRRSLAIAATSAIALGLTSGIAPMRAEAKVRTDRTSAQERKWVDSVPTPTLDWYDCEDGLKCATVKVPLDYAAPKSGEVELAVIKVPARNKKARIGSLFVNPGGPGGSSVALAQMASDFLGGGVLDRFDIIGVDPRGVGYSDNVRCFSTVKDNDSFLRAVSAAPFPVTPSLQRSFIKAFDKQAAACSSTGKPLTAHMSTAEVARDMDLLRRAVGDKKLTYLGFSYGSYLGQVYANMFPDRVRAVVIDGVIDPQAWSGTVANAATPLGDRLRSADGAYKALHEILVRCDRAGGEACSFAPGDPVKNWQLIADRLKAKPVTFNDANYGYANFVTDALGALYYADGAESIAELGSSLIVLTEPPAKAAAARRTLAAKQKEAAAALSAVHRKLAKRAAGTPGGGGPGRVGFPYNNTMDTFQTIACTDSVNAPTLNSMPELAAAADRRAPYFGALWAWNWAACASKNWTVTDPAGYRGPFTRRTAAPVLVVGNYWDPATNYTGAVRASKLLPNSRLLSSDSWGHTAYGTSNCVTGAVDRYLLGLALPAKGKVCVGDAQPFTGTSEPPAELQKRLDQSLQQPRR